MSNEFSDIHYELLNPIEPVFLIDGLIEDQTTGAIIGESGSGKTFAAVSMACSVATGIPWVRCEVKRQGPVIYFAGEGRHGVLRRINAWQLHNKVTLPPGRLFMPRMRVEFNSLVVAAMAEKIKELATKHGTPALLVIDTLARAFPAGGDENSNKDMMAFLNIVEALRALYKCVVVIVHHTGHGKDARARGASAFKAAMDWKFCVDGEKQILKSTKMKEAEMPAPIPFELVEAGQSAVMIFGEPIEADGNSKKLTPADKFGLLAFNETVNRVGRQQITEDEWHDVFYEMHKGKDAEAKRKPFERARKVLVKKGVLTRNGDAFALAGRTGQDETKS